ncbi:hypothetical protein EYF80_016051 [Liparis tanakae]|uniref:Uncharacterized protein n=1 Tax=Liparis tanakae TaxID=230148 RepID=A0A4Z2I7C4_9TELE|nr:hypothetical protein EYF80_016051 [Liparis tanakae]
MDCQERAAVNTLPVSAELLVGPYLPLAAVTDTTACSELRLPVGKAYRSPCCTGSDEMMNPVSRRGAESEGFLWGNGYRAIIHHPRLRPGPSGTLPRQQSVSTAIHHEAWMQLRRREEAGLSGPPLYRGANEGPPLCSRTNTSAILSSVHYHVALSQPSSRENSHSYERRRRNCK